jgi:hypothetical protein
MAGSGQSIDTETQGTRNTRAHACYKHVTKGRVALVQERENGPPYGGQRHGGRFL